MKHSFAEFSAAVDLISRNQYLLDKAVAENVVNEFVLEPLRENVRQANIKVKRLYSDLLTELGQ